MDKLTTIEAILNFFDFGIVIEVIKNSLKSELKMEVMNFLRYLFFGRVYNDLSPPELSEHMAIDKDFVIIDLRDEHRYSGNHIEGAISHPFEDFLKSILIDGEYKAFKTKDLVLICDTGHNSRVAASILAEQGFTRVASLNRGMRRWNKWQNLMQLQKGIHNKRINCCDLQMGQP